jgi:hypothetical protein
MAFFIEMYTIHIKMTQIGSVGGEIWQIGGKKWGSRRGQLGMCAPTGTFQAQELSAAYIWLLSLEFASWRTHTLRTSTPFQALRRPPLIFLPGPVEGEVSL